MLISAAQPSHHFQYVARQYIYRLPNVNTAANTLPLAFSLHLVQILTRRSALADFRPCP